MRKKKLELESRIPRPNKYSSEEWRARYSKKFPELTRRVEMIRENRLIREERRLWFEEDKRRRQIQEESTNEAWRRQKIAKEEEEEDDDGYGIAAFRKPSGFAKGSGSKAKGARKATKSDEMDEGLDSFESQFMKKKEPVRDDDSSQDASF